MNLIFVCFFFCFCCFLLVGHNKLATTAASSFQKHIRLFVCCIIIGKVAKGRLKCQFDRQKGKQAKKQIKAKSETKPKPKPKPNRMNASNAFGNCQWRQGIIETRQGRISLSLSFSFSQLLIALPSLVSCLLGRDVISISEKKLPPKTKQHRVRNEASAEASA